MRFLKRLFFFVLLLVVVVVGGAVSLFYLAPTSWIAGAAADAVREQTGRELVVEGDIERSLFPLSVRVSGVSLSNAEWAGEEPMIEAEAAAIVVRTAPLLSGAIEIEEITLIAPVVRVAVDEAGRSNLEIGSGEPSPPEPGAAPPNFILVNAEVRDGRVLIDDRSQGQQFEITDLTVTAAKPELDAPLTMDGGATVDGRALTLAARLGGEGDAFLRLETPGLAISVEGASDGGAGGSGALTVSYDGTAPETDWIRSLAPPQFAELASLEAQGEFVASEAALTAELSGVALYKGESTDFTASFRSGEGWEAGDLGGAAAVSASNGLFSFSFDGAFALAAEGGLESLNGQVLFDSERFRDFAAWSGDAVVDAPEGAFERFGLTADVVVTPASTAVSNMEMRLDDETVTGEVTVDNAAGDAPPKVTASIVTTAIDLRPFLPDTPATAGASDAAPTGSGAAGWSDEPFDFSYLNLIDADIRVETAGLTLPTLQFTDAVFTAQIDSGALELGVERMTLYSGSATGRVALDARETPQLEVEVSVSGVQLRPFLNDVADMDWLEGTGALEIDIDGAGGSVRALMASLDGTASIDFRDGAIIGYNLAAIVRNITSLGLGDEEERRTDFAEISASFVLQDGVAANDDLLMSGPLIRLSGSGVIDIGNRTVNYRAEPKAVATLEGQGGASDLSGLVFPLLITGPWEDVSVQPDLLGDPLGSVESFLASPEEFGAGLTEAIQASPEFIDAIGGGVEDAIGGALGGESDSGGIGGAIGDAIGGGDEGGGIGGAIGDAIGGGDEGGGIGGAIGDAIGGGDDEGGGVSVPGGLFGD